MDLTPCPQCQRKYPGISEQGVWIDVHGRCFPCVLGEVLAERDRRIKEAGHTVEDCATCFPLHTDPHCPDCDGAGFRKLPLQVAVEGETITPIPT